ncbi:hypothetical protein [Leptospira meyeri]|uniref:hypothetical protein n=1 Tax=Leptospira meyeri TaxID=29508 RepID=UPI0002BFA19A|nr:hypothetical protein [Leptospira meyeri]EMJ89490.1 hypothetical protein LEP1GSC196_0723 [Leptospira meyeri serovar Semaranga str. Veldrot Semarang 173]
MKKEDFLNDIRGKIKNRPIKDIAAKLSALNKISFKYSLDQIYKLQDDYFLEKIENRKGDIFKKYNPDLDISNIDKKDLYELISIYSDESILSIALFLKIYSLIEIYLDKECKIYENHFDLDLKLNDLNGKGIFRPKIFIEKVVKFKITETNEQWEFIVSLNKIRNTLIHSDDYDPKLEKIVKKHFKKDEIKFTDISGIVLTVDFLKVIKTKLSEIFSI